MSLAKTAGSAACPCGSQQTYQACCEPLHAGRSAASALALMRSRYSAYVMGDITYLQDTWHPKTCPANLADEFHRETRWLGLSIKRHETLSTHTALVEFVARYRLGGQPAVRLHETSHFLLENGRWLYVDGKHD